MTQIGENVLAALAQSFTKETNGKGRKGTKERQRIRRREAEIEKPRRD